MWLRRCEEHEKPDRQAECAPKEPQARRIMKDFPIRFITTSASCNYCHIANLLQLVDRL
jgi:hypothetical protein